MALDARRPTIFIAEHDRTVLELLQIRLDVAGFHTTTARTGDLALATLRSMRPAALVMDLHLPELDGFELLSALGAKGERPIYPILATGKVSSIEEVKRAVTLGARDFLAKPYSGADAVDRVMRLLRKPGPAQARTPSSLGPFYVDRAS
ncbi:MAG: response regulator [Pseudomonadota bacterium]|jgi:DNA-binding response OmpR family regulator